MKLIANAGKDRVIDHLRPLLQAGASLDLASPSLSLFAFAELRPELARLGASRLALPLTGELGLAGGPEDRAFRNRLQLAWLARQCAHWLRHQAQLRLVPGALPQAVMVARSPQPTDAAGFAGNCAFSTAGLGLTPGDQFGLVQATETAAEADALAGWFELLWQRQAGGSDGEAVLARLDQMAAPQPPALVYNLILRHILGANAGALDEERLADASTGIRDSIIWRKLFKFQRDGVLGALDKLDRLGGCIIADSVGLGKTFEALAIVKYYELRNRRVLVLCPKRLRDNWTLYKSNDQRNFLAADRLNYDVLNHTDLSRDSGQSGDINLAHVNWGNYDLVVIDESHNFRNKATLRGHETRYDRLMRRIIREGVKTRVLMLSATPVNNRLTDLKNQIAFITEGDDHALREHGIPSLDRTIRQAQLQFKRWLDLAEQARTPSRLVEMLGFDYFTLLDLVTLARSRKHIERYYGTAETGRFPERLRPINHKPDVDRAGEFRSIREINNEIRRLTLAAYAPLRYLLPHKRGEYDAKYSIRIRGGDTFFRQVDREESLVHLLRVNVLKRMESAVSAFALTVERQLADVNATLARIEASAEEVEEINIADIDVDDARYEGLLVGRKVKVLLRDVDLARWRQDLHDDRNRLAALAAAARQVSAARDAKLEALRQVIAGKIRAPINPGNRKVLVFTAFADTAERVRPALRPGHRQRRQPNHRPRIAPRPGLHPHRLLAPLQGAPGRAGKRAGHRSPHRHRLHQRGPKSPGLRLPGQLRHPLEPGAHHPAVRPDRPHRLAQPRCPARQFLAEPRAGRVHQPGAACQRQNDPARCLRHRRGEHHRGASRRRDERPRVPPQAAPETPRRGH
ncbi:MAG TPA: SNF2-related protein [Terriglobales bacterium]|nr:SNF2-related protein [Terriglobales bacterium]